MSAIASRLCFLSLVSCGVLSLLTAMPVQAQSIRVESNSAGTVVDQAGSRFTITGGTQSGSNLFHSFEQFGLSASEVASFISRPDIQNILGRVTGGQASLIDGLLQVTGGNSNLYLLNPAGILFGANARLDLPASFYATTATGIGFGDNTFNAIGSNNYAALIGNPDSFAFTLSQPGAIVNAGNLTVNPGESVGLIGGTVVNTGTISATGGTITLAAISGENRVRVSQEGSLLSLELEPPNGSWEAGINPLPFNPLSLPELLTGGEIATATGLIVNPDGTIQLSGTSIPVQPGTTIASGTLSTDAINRVSAVPQINTGAINRVSAVPQINVLGDRVALVTATLNASATNGGGTVRIGGDYQGQGSVFNASRTFVSQDSTITADALDSGNGGRAIVWADETTRFFGTISAQGGQTAGDGGFVEVSGAQNLLFEGLVNVGATNGQLGTLLLDPTNITISAAADSPGVGAALPDIFEADLPGDITINSTTLAGQTGNVILEASNNITLDPGIALTFGAGAGSITFTADSDRSGAGDFLMNAGSSIDTVGRNITILGANLTLTSLDTGSSGGNAAGGAIALTATGNITADSLNSSNFPIAGDAGNGGAITLNAGGNITISPVIGVNSSSQTNVANGGNGGAISFTAGGDITVGNILDSTSSGGLNSGNGGAITLIAGGNLAVNRFLLSSSQSFSALGTAGNGGAITLTAGGNLTTNSLVSSNSRNDSGGTASNGGAIRFTTTGGNITASGQVSSLSEADIATGNGGVITFTASGNITTANLLSYSGDTTPATIGVGNAGNGGAIALTAGGNIITEFLNSYSQTLSPSGTLGDGGAIILNAGGNITTQGLLSASQSSSTSSNAGDGGAITLIAGSNITTTGATSQSTSGTGNPGNGGAITFTAGANITAGGFTSVASGNVQGTGGAIALTARDSVTATSFSTSNTDITLTGNELDFGSFFGQGNNVILQPFSPDQAIAINGTTNIPGILTLDLLASELQNISATSLTIGRTDGTSRVTLASSSLSLPLSTTATIRGASTLVGGSGNNTWTITGTNAGQVNGINFTSVRNLEGGSGDDTFQFNTDEFFAGNIDDNGGTLRFTGDTVNLTGDITDFVDRLTIEASQGNINVGNITTDRIFGGAITLTANSGAITTGNLSTAASVGGSDITIRARDAITTGDIESGGFIEGNGGTIRLTSQNSSITTRDVTSTDGDGGDIIISAETAITTGAINASGSDGNGGNVTLDPSGDIQVTSINADGGTSGTGGIVDITTGRFFRATGSFINRDGLRSSISTAGGQGGGAVTIRHGGNGATPFVIGADFSGSDVTGINGTAAAITDGVDTFSVGESFDSSITRGNLRLITGGGTPTPTPTPSPTPTPTPTPSPTPSPSPSPDSECVVDCKNNPAPSGDERLTIQEPLVRDRLFNIQDQTGIKPALIYVSFVSTTIPIANTLERQEAIATQQFANHLDRPNPTELLPLTVTPQDSDELTLLLVTPSGETIYRRVPGVTRARVIETANQLRAAVTDPRLVRTRTYLAPAQQLYQWMIAPLEADLQAEEIENIGFILDSGLRTIPLAALHDGQNFLIQNYSIGLMPSLNLVDTRYRDIRNSAVLAAGTSNFQGTGLDPLPAVPAELKAISSLWQGQTNTLEDNQFTIEQLRLARQQQPFGIVHLATHGEFRPGDLENSYIQFSDTRLQLDQVRTLGFNDPPVELMVLSACRMALGSETAELGFAGLAVQAGVKSALASLWSISDEGTLGLMTEFYEELRRQPIKAEALRQAQLAMASGRVLVQGDRLLLTNSNGEEFSLDLPEELGDRGNRDFVHPYYWAGFTLIGSPW